VAESVGSNRAKALLPGLEGSDYRQWHAWGLSAFCNDHKSVLRLNLSVSFTFPSPLSLLSSLRLFLLISFGSDVDPQPSQQQSTFASSLLYPPQVEFTELWDWFMKKHKKSAKKKLKAQTANGEISDATSPRNAAAAVTWPPSADREQLRGAEKVTRSVSPTSKPTSSATATT